MPTVLITASDRNSSSPVTDQLAYRCGQALSHAGWELITTGPTTGLLGAATRGALSAGGFVRAIVTAEIVTEPVDSRLVISQVSSSAEQQQQLFAVSDAFVALPGGLISLALLLAWSASPATRLRPSVLVGPAAYWERLRQLLEQTQSAGFLDEYTYQRVLLPDELVAALDEQHC